MTIDDSERCVLLLEPHEHGSKQALDERFGRHP